MHAWLLETLKRSGKLFADETTAPVLDPGRGPHQDRPALGYARDDRPWGGTDPPGVAYVYAPDRTAGRPIAHLCGFAGVLQVDGYAAYESLARGGAVRLAYCWSGAGFGFFQAPNLRAIMTSAPAARSGGASGIVATARLLGQTLGAALVAACFAIAEAHGPAVAMGLGAAFAGFASVVSFTRLAVAS